MRKEVFMAPADKGETADNGRMDSRLNAISGGVLLIWIGIAMLFDVGWGGGLIVVGIILLGEQTARWIYSVKFNKLWVIAGLIAVFAGILILSGVKVSLIPVLLIAFGISLLISARGAKE
jgi:hypothetical protein